MCPARGPADPPRPHGRIRVAVVDDHRAFAAALSARLMADGRFEVVGVAHTATQGLSLARSGRADLVLLDYLLGDETCLEILAAIRSGANRSNAVVISGVTSVPDMVTGLVSGARAWVSKDTAYADLIDAIEEVTNDGMWLSATLVGPVVNELVDQIAAPEKTFIDDLTPRQQEVLGALLAGMTRDQIAERFVVSPHTVRTHIQQLLRRSGSSSTLELLAKARASGQTHRLRP